MKRKQFLTNSAALLTLGSIPALSSTRDNLHEITTGASRVCATCGTHFAADYQHPLCHICSNDRQYIPEGGQQWTTHEQMLKNLSVRIMKIAENIDELQIKPTFGIGQRALFVTSKSGNVLWDCIPLLNDATIEFIRSRGGLKAIALSHPHYYSNVNDWAKAFDCPIYIHDRDKEWMLNKGAHVNFWTGEEKNLWDGIKIINIGGHFPGSSILHVPSLSKEGVILVGDTITLSPSHQHIAAMYSYPNRIPLPLAEMVRIRKRLDEIPFDTLYGFYSDQNLAENVKQILERSFAKYV